MLEGTSCTNTQLYHGYIKYAMDYGTSSISLQYTNKFMTYYLCLGQNSKDKAYKLSAEYPFRPNSVKAVLSIANTLYTQSSLDVSFYMVI